MRIADITKVYPLTIWIGLLAIILPEVQGSHGAGVGLDWILPYSYFEGVDERGHVLYCDKIGELDVAKDLQIPIFIMFKSSWMADSPYLGKGWILPLLESRIEQTSENSYRLWQPDGWYRDFGCSKSSETDLTGTAGWKAKIAGDIVTAWAPCGWKLVFTKNKLTAIVTPKNQRLELVRRTGQVDELLANELSMLRVERDAMTGRAKGLALCGGKRIAIEQQLRPRVQQIGERNVVKGDDYSLSKVTQVDGTVKTYEYGVDDQMCPTLKIGARLIVWDPGTQLIVKDGEWTYDIKPDEKNPWANAAIGRKNTDGGSEFWYYDGGKGQEITQTLDGIKTVKSWFTSGKLAGKVRKIYQTLNGYTTIVSSVSYDDKGQMMRSTDRYGCVFFYRYDKDKAGREIEKTKNGEIVWRRWYDANGQLQNEERPSNGQKQQSATASTKIADISVAQKSESGY